MDQSGFEPKPSLLMCLPPHYQLPRSLPAAPISSASLLSSKDKFYSDSRHVKNDVTSSMLSFQKYHHAASDGERDLPQSKLSADPLGYRGVAHLSPGSWKQDRLSMPLKSFGMRDKNSYSDSPRSPTRQADYDHHVRHKSLLPGHEGLLYHPYSLAGLVHNSTVMPSKPGVDSLNPPAMGHQGVKKEALSRASPLDQQRHDHHNNVQSEARAEQHNHSSDSGLNDSGTSVVSLDTSDSGVVSGLSGLSSHTNTSDDDTVAANTNSINCSAECFLNLSKLPTEGRACDADDTRKSGRGHNDDDDEDEIRVSSNDDDDDEDGLKSFESALLGSDGNGAEVAADCHKTKGMGQDMECKGGSGNGHAGSVGGVSHSKGQSNITSYFLENCPPFSFLSLFLLDFKEQNYLKY
ncbi:hypothetical protein PoB_000243600 [Plakobranchus ocellatus]|uniref:Uncharacterized protein n=1 Tax=Plakobranchus ocellatus TaxID=259542 RepID=A0AAV3XYM6_9GAST|nr:hypothetical protein PoB_000243600 [Plakobranchus ocellatus]